MSVSLLAMIASNVSPAKVDEVRLALESSSATWFAGVKYAGYAVAFGCFMEAPETFISIRAWWVFWRKGIEVPEDKGSAWKPIAALGLILIVAGIVVETYCEGVVSDIDVKLRTHESELITAAEDRAAAATADAGTARDSAQAASLASSGAITSAATAKKEADSFEAKIASSNALATEAESHLADALERALKAEKALDDIRTPRSIVNRAALLAAIRPFKGTEYVLNVFEDEEAIEFIKSVAGVLDEAGWVRKTAVIKYLDIPNMKIQFKPGVTEVVPSCVKTGIETRVHRNEKPEVLRAMPFASVPSSVRAAVALNGAIVASVSPHDERNAAYGILDPELGEAPMNICVGKKP